MKLATKLLMGVLLAAQVTAQSGYAQETNALELIQRLQQRIDDLEQKLKALEQGKEAVAPAANNPSQQLVEELEQKVKILQRQREIDAEAAAAKSAELPKITVGDRGFALTSADTNFNIQLRGLLQVDSRTFLNNDHIIGNDGILLRRARPILQGTVFRDFDFLFVPDFGGTSGAQIYDAYLNYRLRPELQLQAGKFKVPVGLEQLQSDPYTFFNERALPTALTPNRDLGFELHGELFDGIASYAVGIFNGVGDGRNSSNVDFEDDKSFAGRLFLLPFKTTDLSVLKGFGFGLGGSFESVQTNNSTGLPGTTGGTLPGFATDGQQQFFAYTNTVASSGDHWRLSPQGYWFYGPFGILAEYVISDQEVTRLGPGPARSKWMDNRGWQVAAGWVLTGEEASYAGPIVPRHRFNPLAGDWGAWQLVGRYAELNIDQDAFPLFANPRASARSASAWSVGINWWLNRNVRINASFSHTDFEGGGSGSSAPAVVTGKPENVFFTRMQLGF
jgi:phosphate-selective porin OprO and OprP